MANCQNAPFKPCSDRLARIEISERDHPMHNAASARSALRWQRPALADCNLLAKREMSGPLFPAFMIAGGEAVRAFIAYPVVDPYSRPFGAPLRLKSRSETFFTADQQSKLRGNRFLPKQTLSTAPP
jgi:hypothetical protein